MALEIRPVPVLEGDIAFAFTKAAKDALSSKGTIDLSSKRDAAKKLFASLKK